MNFKQQALDQVRALPAEYLTQQELDSLPEYSTTIPSGTTIGKRWKRNAHMVPGAYGLARPGKPAIWMVCKYIPCDIPGRIGISYHQARLKGERIKALIQY